MAQVTFTIRLPMAIKKRRKWYLASCPILDVHSQGETEEQAKNNLIEALGLFLVSCFERGTLDQLLKECGFTPIRKVVREVKGEDKNTVTVPIPFHIAKAGCHHECHG